MSLVFRWVQSMVLGWMKRHLVKKISNSNSIDIGKRFTICYTNTLIHAKNFNSFQARSTHIYNRKCSFHLFHKKYYVILFVYLIKTIFYVTGSSWLILLKHWNTMMIVLILKSILFSSDLNLENISHSSNNRNLSLCASVFFLPVLSKKLSQPEVIVQFNNAF